MNRGVFLVEHQQLLPDYGFAGGVVGAGAGAASLGGVVGAGVVGAGAGGVAGLSSGLAHPAAVKASPASASTANDVFMMQIPS